MEAEHAPPDFKTHVRDLVESYFRDKGQGLLLSRLGQSLRSQGVDLQAALAGRKLSEVIEQDLGDVISLTTSLVDPKILSAVPKGEHLAPVTPPKPPPAPDQPSIPRISPTVWAAFTKPLPDGHVRILELAPPSFSDIPEAKGDLLQRCIQPKDLTTRDSGVSKSSYELEVFQKISAWLTAQGIELREITANTVSMRHAHSKKSLFHQLYERLSEEQRKRVSLPIDVVESLLRG